MSTIYIIAILSMAVSAPAQWIVYDPTSNIQQIIDQAENFAQYVQMVDNQVQQINTLSSQLQQLEQYNAAFGDPSKILQVTGVNGLVADIEHPTVGEPLLQIQISASGTEALNNDGNGLYHDLGVSFTTPSGNQVTRVADDYKPNTAIDNAANNYTNVYADVQQRRTALKTQIAATTEALQASTTDAETQKLQGVLTGLNAELAATDKEVDQALGLTLVQQAQNQNDQAKQAQARTEEQQAEFSESLQNYHDKFKLTTEAPSFPDNQ